MTTHHDEPDVPPPQETALICCRVSDKKQTTEGSGLQSQEHRCLEHAMRRGYSVERVFVETVSGGVDIKDRPALRDLLHYLHQHKDSGKRYVVVFDDHKRFARETAVHLAIKKKLEQCNARTEYLNFSVDDTPEGTFIDTMLAAQSQLEREQNGRQTRQKTKARLEKGFWTFRAPVGYKYVKSKAGGKELVKHEPLASILTDALEGFASGRFASQAEVKRFLESQPEFPKDLASGEIRNQTMARILSQILYAGYLEAPRQNVSRRKAQHDALISLETFEKIQQRRKDTGYLPARKDISKDFVLRGAVACASCNVPLRSSWTKGNTKYYAYYLCQTKGCTEYGKSIPRDKIEGEFEMLLGTMQPPRGAHGLIKAMFKQAWDAHYSIAQRAAESFKHEVKTAEQDIKQLISRIMQATSPRVIAAYEERIEALEHKKLIAQEKSLKTAPAMRRFDDVLELTMLLLSNPQKLWAKGSFEAKRTLLKLAFSGIVTLRYISLLYVAVLLS